MSNEWLLSSFKTNLEALWLQCTFLITVMIYLPKVSIMICLLLYAQGLIIVLKIDYVWALDLHL